MTEQVTSFEESYRISRAAELEAAAREEAAEIARLTPAPPAAPATAMVPDFGSSWEQQMILKTPGHPRRAELVRKLIQEGQQ